MRKSQTPVNMEFIMPQVARHVFQRKHQSIFSKVRRVNRVKISHTQRYLAYNIATFVIYVGKFNSGVTFSIQIFDTEVHSLIVPMDSLSAKLL